MNIKRWWIASAAAFAFIFLFEWILHGVLLSDLYTQTAALWRPEAEMNQNWWWMLARQIGIAVMMGWIFTKGYEGKGWMEGVRFGLWVGLLFVALEIGKYCYMPVPMSLIWSWAAGMMVLSIGAGVIIAWLYKPETA